MGKGRVPLPHASVMWMPSRRPAARVSKGAVRLVYGLPPAGPRRLSFAPVFAAFSGSWLLFALASARRPTSLPNLGLLDTRILGGAQVASCLADIPFCLSRTRPSDDPGFAGLCASPSESGSKGGMLASGVVRPSP